MKKTGFLLSVLSAFRILCGCNAKDTIPPEALYYLVNATPDSQGWSFLLDGASVKNDLAYGADTGYFQTTPGIHDLKFLDAATAATLVNVNTSMTAGQMYSIFTIGLTNGMQPVAIRDNFAVSPVDTAEIRLFNFYVNSPSLIAQFTGGTDTLTYFSRTFDDQSSDTTKTLFKRVIMGNYTLHLMLAVDSSLVDSIPNLNFGSGKVYTVYLKGIYGDTTTPQELSAGILQHN
jgi:hypothetical protein